MYNSRTQLHLNRKSLLKTDSNLTESDSCIDLNTCVLITLDQIHTHPTQPTLHIWNYWQPNPRLPIWTDKVVSLPYSLWRPYRSRTSIDNVRYFPLLIPVRLKKVPTKLLCGIGISENRVNLPKWDPLHQTSWSSTLGCICRTQWKRIETWSLLGYPSDVWNTLWCHVSLSRNDGLFYLGISSSEPNMKLVGCVWFYRVSFWDGFFKRFIC